MVCTSAASEDELLRGPTCYTEAYRDFTWGPHLAALGWIGQDAVDLAHTIAGRHARPGRVALRWFGKRGQHQAWGFADLARAAARFANLLRECGVAPGDRVAGLMPRIPETLVAMLGTWQAGAIYVPIFTGFGADAIRFRVEDSGARVLVTHHEHRPRVAVSGSGAPRIVTVAPEAGEAPARSDHPAGSGRASSALCADRDFREALARQPDACEPVRRRRDEPAVLLYTSGSTGPPKGVAIAVNFLLAIHPYATYALDLRPDDVFWPTGDPGWGYGLVCYMGALATGTAVVSDEAAPTPEYALARIRDLGITNLATTPTVLRGLMALGEAALTREPVRVRAMSSCGEPLNAEVVSFFQRAWRVTPMDQYGSSETGLPIGNFNALRMEVRPGSMGQPLPGCRMAVVDDDGREVPPGTVGHIGLRPSDTGYYALGYWRDPERTRALFRQGWLTIGDLARRDADGYFWFEGRADDVITSAGYRIGPFEVESTILHHPAVAEAAVVGKPDRLRGHIVKAYVVLRPGVAPPPGLVDEIVAIVKDRLGRPQAPREVEVVDRLPKTETGKIQRFLLRQRESGSGAMEWGAGWASSRTAEPRS